MLNLAYSATRLIITALTPTVFFLNTDINECLEGTDDCDDTNSNCMNVEGGFTCECKLGFVMNQATEECEGNVSIISPVNPHIRKHC